MSEFIKPNVSNVVTSARLPEEHLAKKFVSGMPAWHPVRELFTGPSQWLGQLDEVFVCLWLFSVVYANLIHQAGREGLLQAAAPPEREAEYAAFERLVPDDVLMGGRAYKIREVLATARRAIEATAADYPKIRDVALRDFDTTFAKLVRAVRWS